MATALVASAGRLKLLFQPQQECALATSATFAPGSNVSSTIRRFSATARHLRTRRSAPNPSARTMTQSSGLTSTLCQRGRLDAYFATEMPSDLAFFSSRRRSRSGLVRP